MCLQGIKIGRKLAAVTGAAAIGAGATADLVPPRADRVRFILGGSDLSAVSGRPPLLLFSDYGGTAAVIGYLDEFKKTDIVRIEDVGTLLLGRLFVTNTGATTPDITWADLYAPNGLEGV